LQELLKRLQDRHGECAQAVAKAEKAAAHAPNVLYAMMLFQHAKNRAKAAQDRAKASQDRAKAAQDQAKASNKVALQTEKENDSAQKEVQELQRVMEPKRARSHAATAHENEDCEKQSSDDWNLADYRREAARIQNHRSVAIGSREAQWCPLDHSRLGLVGWIAYWSIGNCGLPRPCPWISPVCGVVYRLGHNGPLKRMHTGDLDITGCVSLVMQVIALVVRSSSISRIARGRIIWAHASTKETVLSSSTGGTTDWRRMRQDSRSKSGRRTLTHHGHLWLC
jgi:hypothetical protein